MAKVIVGMSGGVDSSVTAYLLKEQGLSVEGVSFVLYDGPAGESHASPLPCSSEATAAARETADRLHIVHATIDLRNVFKERVISPFIDGYRRGTTPNPCILCNRYVKFPYLLKRANDTGSEFVATGHYAKTHDDMLMRGMDIRKDQSYVLHVLGRQTLKRLLLPLGERTKTEVRAIARSLRMPASEQPESQEICFISGGSCVGFLDANAGARMGSIVDIESGRRLGSHQGIHLYTIGQRKRLVPVGRPLFVARIDPSSGTVFVGPRERALIAQFTVGSVNWIIPKACDFRATVKIRSTMKDEAASVTILSGGKVRILFDEPQWAPAAGQSAVFYDGDMVIGGGVIVAEHG